jgi:hypothetical protein
MQHLKLSALSLLAGLLMMAALSAAMARSAPPPPSDTGLPRPYWLRLDPARPVETILPPLRRALARRQVAGDVVRFDRALQGGALRVVARPGAADKLRSLPGVVGVSDAPPGPKPTPAPSGKAGILATGAIAGVVTAAGSGARLSGIEVCAESDYAYECDTTGSSGTYTIGDLDTDSYRVDFYDDSGTYVYKYYHNKPDWDRADLVAVTDGAVTRNINATLVRAGHIAGTVTAEGSGAPLSDISVCADNATTDECAYTDDDGTYDIGGLGTGSYTVDFYNDSGTYAEEYYNNKPDWDTADLVGVTAGKTTRAINAVLSLPGHITGVVSAEQGGAGLGDISVCADRGVWYDDYHCATTDDTGVYDIDGLGTGSYRVQFTDDGGVYASEYYNNKPDWDTANLVAVTAGRTTRAINAALAVRGHIAGVVTAESDGALLSGIEVCVHMGLGWDYGDEPCATTDGDGVYNIGSLDSGSYRVWFRDASATYVGEYYDDKPELDWSNSVAVAGGITTSDINAALARPGHLTGTVTAADGGAPLSGVEVCADDTANGYDDDEYCATTNGGGTYDIGGLPGGTYQVVFYANSPAYVSEYYADKLEADEADWVAVTAGSSTPNINAALSVAGQITGVVTAAESGEPLDSIEVCAHNGFRNSCTTTDSNGAYEIDALGAGSYKVMFRNEDDWGDYARQYYDGKSWETADPVVVTSGHTTPNINAEMSLGGHITGEVFDEEDYMPLDEVDVCADDSVTPLSYCGTTGDGSYDIGGLPGGTYRVGFFGNGYYGDEYYNDQSRDTADWVTVTAGHTVPNIDAGLSAAGRIIGSVTAEGSGAPLTDIQVCVDDWNCATTDGDGMYDLNYGLGAHNYKVKFTDLRGVYASEFYNNKLSSSTADPVAVAAGRTTRNINAVLSASGHITGIVTEAGGGAPLANIEVTAYRYNGAGWDEVGVTHTDSTGRYGIALPSGTYRIRFEDRWWGDHFAAYYWDGATPGGATSISLAAPATLPDINASLSPPSAWVYLPLIIRK